MKPGLEPGGRACHAMLVGPSHLVRTLLAGQSGGAGAFPDVPAVLATAQMVGLMEWACVEQLRPFHEDGGGSLEVHVDFDHAAPTLPGHTVAVESADGRSIRFRAEARDAVEPIGGGGHRRAVIDAAGFAERLAARRAAAGL